MKLNPRYTVVLLAGFLGSGALHLHASTIQEMYAFPTNAQANVFPNGLTSLNGAFYGTTANGGGASVGTVFRYSSSGFLTLTNFSNPDGNTPQAPLIPGLDGALYGTTVFGGTGGNGTIYRVTTNGDLSTLGSFGALDGTFASARLLLAPDGSLYGTTANGPLPAPNYGTVFRLSTNGTLSTLVSFASTNGSYPYSSLAAGNDGAFYGTTSQGGKYDSGTIFSITTNGSLTTLISFNSTNGAAPYAGLTLGPDAAFYGVTSSGGSHSLGTIFRITTNGIFTSLFSFNGSNGSDPESDLTMGPDGALYGTTLSGGTTDNGTLFQITTNGTFTSLASFNGTNGIGPYGALVIAADGSYYGTTRYGGSLGGGNIFRFGQVNANCTMSLARAGTNWNVGLVSSAGASFRLVRATNLLGPWITLSNFTFGPGGTAQYTDTNLVTGRAFYRAVTP